MSEQENLVQNTRTMPLVALRNMLLFPGAEIQFDVGRSFSVAALESAMRSGREIFLVAQKDLSIEIPEPGDLYEVGTVARLKQLVRLPNKTLRVLVEGCSRGRLVQLIRRRHSMAAEVEVIPPNPGPRVNTPEVDAYINKIYTLIGNFVRVGERVSVEVYYKILSIYSPGFMTDYSMQNLPFRFEEKQRMLEELDPARRVKMLYETLVREVQVMEIEDELESKTQEQLVANQRDYVLREQLRVIQRELGEKDEGLEVSEYIHKIRKAHLPDEVREKLLKEVKHLEKQPFGSAEGAVLRGYLDVCLELPWAVKTDERVKVSAVSKALDEDHFGLEKVKERILEFVAVKQLAPDLKGQVLCLVGPPGVGKTSIAKSVARAMNRNLARISLGGVHDEAEIRGHRKTYIGAMPGRIISGIQQAGSANPVLLLDEIDKVGGDHRGDPASALLEVLDAEQNSTFRDHYLEVPFDLSDVMFITTANTTQTIPKPLLDRMEVIELSSYTDVEKLQIAKRYLLPREMKRHGLSRSQLKVSDGALRRIISEYTRESGVRRLERLLASICRKGAMRLVQKECSQVSVVGKNLEQFLGAPRYLQDNRKGKSLVGVVNGLAWTSVGGEILEVEVNVVDGTGKLALTGNLGDVMKESAQAALSFIRSRAGQLGIPTDFYQKKDVHVHFPEGAVPKDGPSAGIAITTAMVSALTGIPVRQDVAMTGEVTLRGRVLAIGGLREKTMAALRHGIGTVFIPAANEKDLDEIDQTVRQNLTFVPVKQVEEVLDRALDTKRGTGGKGYPAADGEKETNPAVALHQ